MNKEFKNTVENLTIWFENLINDAKNDAPFSVSFFRENDFDGSKFCIVGGWSEGFDEDYANLLCLSKSNPKYAMCVKIAVNNGPYAYIDFDLLDMPVDAEGNVDDTCIALELDDEPEALAAFFLNELERITKAYAEVDQE